MAPTEYTYTINDVEYTFIIYNNGEVYQEDTDELICEDSG